jgi:hypothetical protein
MHLGTELTQDPWVQVLDAKNFQSDGRVMNQDWLEQTAAKKKLHLHNFTAPHISLITLTDIY